MDGGPNGFKYLSLEQVEAMGTADVELPLASGKYGGTYGVKVRALANWEMLEVMPDYGTGDAEYAKLTDERKRELRIEWERWIDKIVSRAAVEPKLTEAQVANLGADRVVLYTAVMGISGRRPHSFRPEGAADPEEGGAGVRETADGAAGDAGAGVPAESGDHGDGGSGAAQ